ncbi:CDP-glycerol glycerophosphotransferase family protein [Loigolactobacillus bifermentans]|uniref:CDP-glycerol poly(Glycerophosphate) glycerophosphotransferase n=1 Tax=Loigolactobacillus bifermentans DSM 20003 TaxID=1423726 RepID=A0A0R1H0U3_9LACO|nr:CDP-glycerol glycerophosphotransferase family protein [Loigolactobacillus bifermentans]KRK40198.1 CDP-glycerol poly(glycerophosphate) glycerophosphotransferase [Loigolactobacillus bifermentans DSM 20003]QGG61671.1 CDP-glycerol--glycerophosphate glycerophosphotransferase [Loigolactobacillus bifermentans]
MQKIKSKIKHSPLLGKLYLMTMGLVLKIMQLFIPIDNKKIIFSSFSGRQLSDSPYVIYQQFLQDPDFKDYDMVWAFVEPQNFPKIPPECKVKIDTFSFWKQLLESKFWVSNSSIERLIPTIHGKHIYINTWHGIPLKHLGPDEGNLEFLVKNWFKTVNFDLLYCSGKYDQKIFKHIFPNTQNIQVLGLPRNLELTHQFSETKREKMFHNLNLSLEKETILYAPTFREYSDVNGLNEFALPFSNRFINEITKDFNVLVRGHYFVESLDVENASQRKIINVSDYSNLNDLFQISDIVISDYSSLIFDYSLLNKRIVLYLNDIEEYEKYRGFYLNPKHLDLPKAYNEDELIEKIYSSNDEKAVKTLNIKFNEYFDSNSQYLKKFIINKS